MNFHCQTCKVPLTAENCGPAALLEGRQHICRECNNKRCREAYHKNPNKREYMKKRAQMQKESGYFQEYFARPEVKERLKLKRLQQKQLAPADQEEV